MADPISLISLVEGSLGLILQCGSVAKSLYDMAGKFQQAQLTIMSLVQEVETIEMAWTRIKGWSLDYGETTTDTAFFTRLDRSLECGTLVISALERDLASYDGTTASLNFRQRSKIAWNESALLDHQHRIRGQVQAMSLLLQVLDLPSPRDRRKLLQTSSNVLRTSDESAYSIVPSRQSSRATDSRMSSSKRNRDSYLSIESMELVYRRLSFENDLFTARVYKRNYRNNLISSLFRSGSRARPHRNGSIAMSRSSSVRLGLERTPSSARPSRNSSLRHYSPSRGSSLSRNGDTGIDQERFEEVSEQRSSITMALQKAQGAVNSGRNVPAFFPPTPIREEFPAIDPLQQSETSSPTLEVDAETSLSHFEESKITLTCSDMKDNETVNRELDHHDAKPLLRQSPGQTVDKFDFRRIERLFRPTDLLLESHLEIGDGSSFPASLQRPLRRSTSSLKARKSQSPVDLGDMSAVHRSLSPEAQSTSGCAPLSCSPLHMAIAAGDINLTRLLIKEGAPINNGTASGMQPIHLASKGGYVEIVRILLDAGAAAKCSNISGRQPLHLVSAYTEAPDIISLLANDGADVDAEDLLGCRPLQLARYFGHNGNIERLLDLGATENPVDGKTPWSYTLLSRHC